MLSLVDNSLAAVVRSQLEGFGQRVESLGFGFAAFGMDGAVAFHTDRSVIGNTERLFHIANKALEQNSHNELLESAEAVCARYLVVDGKNVGIAVISCRGAAEGTRRCLNQMLELFIGQCAALASGERQMEVISTELAQTYEELVLLYKMGASMKVTQNTANYLQMACDGLTDMVSVEGIAILLDDESDKDDRGFSLIAGSGLIDVDSKLSELLRSRLAGELSEGREALLDSEIDGPFKYDWPERIRNIIAVPLIKKGQMIGLLVAINRLDKPDFDSIDIKLFTSVATQCAVFVHNTMLFADLKDLFMGSLKALTASIDAKDQYTHGHSERVAFIAKWIAETIAETDPLSEEEIQRIYLAGLLHDIGKIGIDERVLRNTGELAPEDRKAIMSHPAIGASILSDIKQMEGVVPGVLCHHERVDGGGYPNGLKGDDIPMIGKIINVADSFDAMTSKRTYRDAMSMEQAIIEIQKGIGKQFDERIANIFLRSDVEQLWQFIQDGMTEVWNRGKLNEYSVEAVGALIQ
jgi:HD-GYP domain-containing protein (c-di-GMP phosphodiesterase class II)